MERGQMAVGLDETAPLPDTYGQQACGTLEDGS